MPGASENSNSSNSATMIGSPGKAREPQTQNPLNLLGKAGPPSAGVANWIVCNSRIAGGHLYILIGKSVNTKASRVEKRETEST